METFPYGLVDMILGLVILVNSVVLGLVVRKVKAHDARHHES